MLQVNSGWLPEWAGGQPTTPDPIGNLRQAADSIINAVLGLQDSSAGGIPMEQRTPAVIQALTNFNQQWEQFQQSQNFAGDQNANQ